MKFVNVEYRFHAQKRYQLTLNLEEISHITYEPYTDGYGWVDKGSICVHTKSDKYFYLTSESSNKLLMAMEKYS